jgi:hypothetical protein
LDEWLVRWGKHGEILEVADQVREMMASLDWGSDVTALGASCPKHNLTRLLSDEWMDDEIVDMTMHDLATRVRLDPELSKTTVVASLSLQSNIEQVFRTGDYSKTSVPLLYRYTEMLKGQKWKMLYLPTHVNKNHWVPMRLDFENRTLEYGEQHIS